MTRTVIYTILVTLRTPCYKCIYSLLALHLFQQIYLKHSVYVFTHVYLCFYTCISFSYVFFPYLLWACCVVDSIIHTHTHTHTAL